jgi:hypothetical protein
LLQLDADGLDTRGNASGDVAAHEKRAPDVVVDALQDRGRETAVVRIPGAGKEREQAVRRDLGFRFAKATSLSRAPGALSTRQLSISSRSGS